MNNAVPIPMSDSASNIITVMVIAWVISMVVGTLYFTRPGKDLVVKKNIFRWFIGILTTLMASLFSFFAPDKEQVLVIVPVIFIIGFVAVKFAYFCPKCGNLKRSLTGYCLTCGTKLER